ncbi:MULTISPECIES: tripartite tricarboxylate transporter substrate binding protein [Cupriavidus]|nr:MULTISPECIES: tripartite tricarboxylate transporter substrate binding protein [Cupriavidus]MCA3192147.1 tripartite tricarboxylate transporter substrate binding protein [Cupriavidus sp.]MCA3197892.1 tripartite tricarboxylate transporter substrate binding protein [Cupriavidus sp.]MCA3202945.1 tripartite tricarboxylate transporter substrate binding protein [Cupriavidus sp.]MCA3231778.1 tripartite tricarboxylate transporter substrate binding protein [Cupriavidus sp.]MCM3606132.1 tripartite tric
MNRRRAMLAIAGSTTCALFPELGNAQAAWPSKPIKLVVPYPAGAISDYLGRYIGRVLSTELGTPVVVENKPGAGTNIGSDSVAKAAPDGYTLLLASSTNAVNVTLFPKLTYSPTRDLTPISIIADVPNCLVVNRDFKANTVADLIKAAKSDPGGLAYASAGPGSPAHLAAEMFNRMAGVQIRNISYKGASPAMADVIAGHVPIVFSHLAAVRGAYDAGKVKILAVASKSRWPVLPNIPTIAESGVAGYEAGAWYGLMAPAGTPKPILDRLQAALSKMRTPATAEAIRQQGADLRISGAEDLKTRLDSDIKTYAALIKTAGIVVE